MTEMRYRATNHGADAIYSALGQLDWDAGDTEIVIQKAKGTRTLPQNNAMHLYIKNLAGAMAAAGLDMRTAIKVPISPTPENIKEAIIRPVLKAMFPDKTSTKELSKTELSALYEQINQMTGDRWGISMDFPHREGL